MYTEQKREKKEYVVVIHEGKENMNWCDGGLSWPQSALFRVGLAVFFIYISVPQVVAEAQKVHTQCRNGEGACSASEETFTQQGQGQGQETSWGEAMIWLIHLFKDHVQGISFASLFFTGVVPYLVKKFYRDRELRELRHSDPFYGEFADELQIEAGKYSEIMVPNTAAKKLHDFLYTVF